MENIEYRKSPLRRTLETVDLKLRALEQSDIDYLFSTENDESYWDTSCTREPISAEFLRKYIENSNLGIYESKQLRLKNLNKWPQGSYKLTLKTKDKYDSPIEITKFFTVYGSNEKTTPLNEALFVAKTQFQKTKNKVKLKLMNEW